MRDFRAYCPHARQFFPDPRMTATPLHEVFGLACGLSLQPSMARAHRHDDVELILPLDGSAVREAGLLRAGLPFLTPVFSDAHWRVWAVHGAPGLALGSAKLTRLDVDGFTLRFPAPGTSEVLVHYSPYWQVLSGSACVSPAANGWTLVTSTAAGTVRVASRWSLTGMIGSAGSCVTGRDQAGTQ